MTDSSIPQSDTPAPNLQRNEEYLKQLGYFATTFACVESRLFVSLIVVSGVSLEIGRALFSGTRAKEAMSFITRILAVKEFPNPVPNIMKSCFDQVNAIISIRNHIFHYGTDFREDSLKTSNIIRAHLPENEITLEINPGTLNNMSLDLLQAISALEYCSTVLLGRQLSTPSQAATKAERRTWLYKPPGQASKGNKTPGSDPKPKRPPRSSPE